MNECQTWNLSPFVFFYKKNLIRDNGGKKITEQRYKWHLPALHSLNQTTFVNGLAIGTQESKRPFLIDVYFVLSPKWHVWLANTSHLSMLRVKSVLNSSKATVIDAKKTSRSSDLVDPLFF